MKTSSAVPRSIRDSVVIVRCRGVELDGADRGELLKAETAIGQVFQKIHRIEWILTGRTIGVEVRCGLRALSGEFAASAIESNARASLQAVTRKILKQKRRAKTIAVTRRKAASSSRSHP